MPPHEYPDSWVVIKIADGSKYHHRVIAGWNDNSVESEVWKVNSGVKSVEETDTHYVFRGVSSSSYHCPKDSYGLTAENSGVYIQLKDLHGDKIELLDEDQDWLSINWIVK